MQKADKNRDPRHINRCQLPWMAKKKESNFPAERFITRLAEGTDRRRRGLAGGSRGAAGRAHTAPTSQLLHPRGQESLRPRLSLRIRRGPVPLSQLRDRWRDKACKTPQKGLGTGQPLSLPPRGAGKGLQRPCRERRDQSRREGSSTQRGVSGWQHPRRGEAGARMLGTWAEGHGGLWPRRRRDLEGCFGRAVLAGPSGKRRADRVKDRGLLAGGSREGHAASNG